jgi:hypothetical protein
MSLTVLPAQAGRRMCSKQQPGDSELDQVARGRARLRRLRAGSGRPAMGHRRAEFDTLLPFKIGP